MNITTPDKVSGQQHTAAEYNAFKAAINSKQDAEEGKGLSSNDFTDADKAKLDSISDDGGTGTPGKSAYQIAVDAGFVGTEHQWLESLKGADGADGTPGKSAYQSAVDAGFLGTEAEWVQQTKINVANVLALLGLEGSVLPRQVGDKIQFDMNWNGVFGDPQNIPDVPGAVVLRSQYDALLARVAALEAGGGGTDPDAIGDLPGVFLHLNARDGVTQVSGEVDTVADQSPTGLTAHAFNAAQRPAITLTGPGGSPAFAFGGNSTLVIDALPLPASGELSMFFVAKFTPGVIAILAEMGEAFYTVTGRIALTQLDVPNTAQGADGIEAALQLSGAQAKYQQSIGYDWCIYHAKFNTAAAPKASSKIDNSAAGGVVADDGAIGTGGYSNNEVLYIGSRAGSAAFFGGEITDIVMCTDPAQDTAIYNALKSLHNL